MEHRDILVSERDLFLYYTTLILIYNVLPSSRLYYIQSKEVKIL